jgi:hypothetical protein
MAKATLLTPVDPPFATLEMSRTEAQFLRDLLGGLSCGLSTPFGLDLDGNPLRYRASETLFEAMTDLFDGEADL